MVANNQQTNWVPEHLRDGRMGKWLENARDWAISRNWQLGCLLSHETRDVSGALGFSYSANIASCSAQFTLR